MRRDYFLIVAYGLIRSEILTVLSVFVYCFSFAGEFVNLLYYNHVKIINYV